MNHEDTAAVDVPGAWADRGVSLRPITAADQPWIRRLYVTTRAEELTQVPWPEANPSKPITYPSDFSFLPGLAQAACADADAGPLWNNQDAQATCPNVCTGLALGWNGQWTTTVPGSQSVCGRCVSDAVAKAHAKR